MAELAFQSEELELEEWQRAGARHLYNLIQDGMAGRPPTASELIRSIQKQGQDSALLESALLLPLDEYRQVEEVYKKAPKEVSWRHPRKKS